MNTLLWVVLMLLVGLGVMVLEVFVPSGGILGFVSIAALVAAIATAFLEQGPVAGLAVVAVVVAAVPVALGLAFRWFPETPLGRRVLPPPPKADDLVPDPGRRQRMRDLVGRSGRAVSELLPWGMVAIDGIEVDALSESGAIEVGVAIEAVAAQGTALVVRRREADGSKPKGGHTPESRRPAPAESAPAENAAPEGDSALSPTLEAFEFEGLEPPEA
ncbi:MAG: NfeD family protein [Planctomycetes bacterium]|nr:NfeD family protein [Planctomycetota bacterium]